MNEAWEAFVILSGFGVMAFLVLAGIGLLIRLMR